jgi:hypothetical protein
MCLSSPRGARDETPVGQASAKAAPAKMDHVRQQAPPDMDVSKRETQEPTTVSLQREPPPTPRLECVWHTYRSSQFPRATRPRLIPPRRGRKRKLVTHLPAWRCH